MRRFAAALALLVLVPSAAADTLVVANKADATTWLLDPDTGEVEARLDVGRGPHEVATSPDGRFAVVANYGEGGAAGSTLSVIDIQEGRIHRGVDLGEHRRPHGLAFLDRERLLVTSETSAALLVVDVFTGRVSDLLPTEARSSHMVVAGPLGHRAHVSSLADGSVTTLELDQLRSRAQTETGAGAEGIALSPDGREAWVANRAEDTLTIIDLDTMALVARLPTGEFPIRVAFTPDGGQAWVSNARGGDVWVYDVRSRSPIAAVSLTAPGGDSAPVPIGLLVRPCGSEVFVALSGVGEIAVVDARTLRVSRRLKAGGQPDGMAWARSELDKTPGLGAAFEDLLSFRGAPGRRTQPGS